MTPVISMLVFDIAIWNDSKLYFFPEIIFIADLPYLYQSMIFFCNNMKLPLSHIVDLNRLLIIVYLVHFHPHKI